MTNSVSMRKEFNKEIEKNLKFLTKAGHLVQSEGEKIIHLQTLDGSCEFLE